MLNLLQLDVEFLNYLCLLVFYNKSIDYYYFFKLIFFVTLHAN